SLTVFHPVESPLRQGSYRGLANPANTFAREVHLDEIGELTGLDPVALRLKNLADPRLLPVLNKAIEISGWASAGERKNSMGVALAVDAATYVAEVAEVDADSSGRIAVTKVWAAVDCGAVVNPDILQNQIEGAIVQAIGYTLREKILFEDGKILTSSFSDYLASRISDVPAIEIAVVNNPRTPSTGIGEPPAVPLAAAVANAASRHLKKRFRSLPLNSPLD
ncbi:MAG TPA: molybdopterin cofactor-binding domain-containing protein, partial [Acidobacteriota bacterium]